VWLVEKTFRATRRDRDGGDGDGWRNGQEERNIRYVAITRSKAELIWLQGEIE
jgi:superfamily I DNA/RNA helicase